MNEFIEKNKRLLKIYCVALRIIGLLLLILGCVGIILLLLEASGIGGNRLVFLLNNWSLDIFKRSWFVIMLPGLAALVVAQFIRYLFDVEYQPGWILRYGDKILYVFAIFVFWYAVNEIWLSVSGYLGKGYSLPSANPYSSTAILSHPYEHLFLVVLPVLLLGAAKLLALVGLGQILRRIMSIIKESRTLV